MRYLLLYVFLLLFSLPGLAQTETEYLDGNFKKIQNKEEAAYYKVISFDNEEKSSKKEVTYFITGEKYKESASKKSLKGSFLYEGPLQKWHKNGQLYYATKYQGGKQIGEALGYYPSGKLKRRELFVDGKLGKGECFKEDGTPGEFYAHEEWPLFPGGSAMFNNYLARNMKYPAAALRKGIEGSVWVQFTVDENGKVINPEILRNDYKTYSKESLLIEESLADVKRRDRSAGAIQDAYKALDTEALRVIHSLPNYKPATEEGIVKKFTFTLPISFKMQSNRYTNPDPGIPNPNSPNNRMGQGGNRRF